MKNSINCGFLARNCPPNSDKNKTVIITGISRSGTSMMAGLVMKLGINLGNRITSVVKEDVEIADYIEKNKIAKLRELIKKNNMSFESWGFKRPHIYEKNINIFNEFRNPIFIIMYRDSLAISLRNRLSANSNFESNFKKVAEDNLKLVSFAINLTYPMLLVSYEKALLNKEDLVVKLSKFLDIELNPNKQEELIKYIQESNQEYLAGL